MSPIDNVYAAAFVVGFGAACWLIPRMPARPMHSAGVIARARLMLSTMGRAPSRRRTAVSNTLATSAGYPSIEPMAWAGEIDAELPRRPAAVCGLIVFAVVLVGVGLLCAS